MWLSIRNSGDSDLVGRTLTKKWTWFLALKKLFIPSCVRYLGILWNLLSKQRCENLTFNETAKVIIRIKIWINIDLPPWIRIRNELLVHYNSGFGCGSGYWQKGEWLKSDIKNFSKENKSIESRKLGKRISYKSLPGWISSSGPLLRSSFPSYFPLPCTQQQHLTYMFVLLFYTLSNIYDPAYFDNLMIRLFLLEIFLTNNAPLFLIVLEAIFSCRQYT